MTTTPATIDSVALRVLLGANNRWYVRRWIQAHGIKPIGRTKHGAHLYNYADIERATLPASSTTMPEATPTWIPDAADNTTTINITQS